MGLVHGTMNKEYVCCPDCKGELFVQERRDGKINVSCLDCSYRGIIDAE